MQNADSLNEWILSGYCVHGRVNSVQRTKCKIKNNFMVNAHEMKIKSHAPPQWCEIRDDFQLPQVLKIGNIFPFCICVLLPIYYLL